MKTFLTNITLFFLIVVNCSAQQWKNWNTGNSPLPTNGINCLALDSSNNVWMATYQGVIKFDGQNWTIYNQSNSPIPNNACYAIATEGNTIWIGSVWGLVKFDGDTNWTVYTSGNSGLPYSYIVSIDVDMYGNKWIGTLHPFGTMAGGVTKFDGTNWTTYNMSNSNISSNWAFNTFVDRTNVKWIGTTNGLNIYNDSVWTYYIPSNSGLPDYSVGKVKEDLTDSLYWIATNNGLALFDWSQNAWTVYDTSNGLSNNEIGDIAIDSLNRKWISCHYTIAMYDNSSWTIFDTNNVGSFLGYPDNLLFDNRGNLWITTGYGLVFYGDTMTLTNVVDPPFFTTKFDFDIFPIPTSDFLNIRSNEFISSGKLCMFDTNGKNIFETDFARLPKKAVDRIDVSFLKPGIYFMKMTKHDQSSIHKIVITR